MRSEGTERRGRGVRRVAVLVALLLAAVGVSLALAACGNDDSSDTTTAATVAGSPEEAYANGLGSATEAVAGLGAAIVSGGSDEDVASDLRTSLDQWQSAIGDITDLDLTDDLSSQRDDLVASSGAFVDAWNAVADEWESGATGGLLELVQQRTPIIDGIDALQSSVTGLLSVADEEISAQLEDAEDQLSEALSEIEGASP